MAPHTATHPTRGRHAPSRRESKGKAQVSAPKVSQPNPATDERDEVYGVVSVLYHALQGAETYTQYIEDARRAGDEDLVEFFEECRDDETERASRAKEFLAMRLGIEAAEAAEEEDEEEDQEEEEEASPRH